MPETPIHLYRTVIKTSCLFTIHTLSAQMEKAPFRHPGKHNAVWKQSFQLTAKLLNTWTYPLLRRWLTEEGPLRADSPCGNEGVSDASVSCDERQTQACLEVQRHSQCELTLTFRDDGS